MTLFNGAVLESFIIYNLFLIYITVLCIILWIVRRTHEFNPNIIYALIVTSFVLFTGLRFDVGTDYFGHLEDFIYKSYSKFAPLYLQLNKVFLNVNYGFIYVVIISCIITYFFLFDDLRFKNTDYIAIPVFICLFLFQFNNLIRQAIAIAIFLYSIQFIYKHKPLLFCLFVLLASAFHSSALFLFPFYFISYIKINKFVALAMVLLLQAIIDVEIVIGLILQSITDVPYYSHYVFTDYIASGDSNTGLGYLAKLCIGVILLLKKDMNSENIEYNTYYNLFTIGILLMPFASKIALIDRIDYYFFITILYILPHYLKSINKNAFDLVLKFTLLLLCLALFEAGLYFNTAKNSPYKTVFSKQNTNIVTTQ